MLIKEEAKISRPVSIVLMLDGVTVPVPVMKCEIGGVVEDVPIVNGDCLHLCQRYLEPLAIGVQANEHVNLQIKVTE